MVWAGSIDREFVHTVLSDPFVFFLTGVFPVSSDIVSEIECESLGDASLFVGVLENGCTSIVILSLLILGFLIFLIFGQLLVGVLWLLGSILEVGVVFLDEKALLVEDDFGGLIFWKRSVGSLLKSQLFSDIDWNWGHLELHLLGFNDFNELKGLVSDGDHLLWSDLSEIGLEVIDIRWEPWIEDVFQVEIPDLGRTSIVGWWKVCTLDYTFVLEDVDF